jgi:hypothetical protein
MKTIMLSAVGFGLLLVSAPTYAQWGDDTGGFTFSSQYQGKKYVSSMPSETLNASPDFDTTNATLPKSIKEIVEIAHTQLEKVTGPKSGWTLESFTLHHSYQNEKKWFYALHFDSPVHGGNIDNITILVTVDGHLGVIKEIQERKIE